MTGVRKPLIILAFGLIAGAVMLSACGGAAASGTGGEAQLKKLGGIAGTTRWGYGCLGNGANAIKDLNCLKVNIAVENAYLPFNYVNLKTGSADGWDYHAWREICTRLHCEAVFVETPWETPGGGMIKAVSDKQFDAAADGITITAERRQQVDFSEGYINIEERLLVRKDESRFASMADLVKNDKLVVGTQSSTTDFDTAKKYLPDSRVKGYPDFPSAVQALLAGDVDAVVIDETAGQGYVGGNADKVKLVGPSLSSDQLGFIFPKGSDLVTPVNQVLDAMRADGTLQKLASQFFGADFKLTSSDIGAGAYATPDVPATPY